MLILTHPVELVPGEDHAGNIPCPPHIHLHWWPVCNSRFADDIDLMGSSNRELKDLTNRLVDRATAYGIKVSTEKSKIMENSTNITSAAISVNGQKLERVTSFK